MTPEIQRGAKNVALWEGLAALDAYRRKFESAPATLRNPVLLGTLLIPLGLMPRKAHSRFDEDLDADDAADNSDDEAAGAEEPGNSSTFAPGGSADKKGLPAPAHKSRFKRPPKEPILKIGSLPIARGDTERLRQILSLQSRIADLEMSPRAKRSLMHRGPFEDALTWFEIHANAPAVLEHWKGFIEALGPEALRPPTPEEGAAPPADGRPPGANRRRRGRRRRGGRSFNKPPES